MSARVEQEGGEEGGTVGVVGGLESVVSVCVCVCVCVCISERERERERECVCVR